MRNSFCPVSSSIGTSVFARHMICTLRGSPKRASRTFAT